MAKLPKWDAQVDITPSGPAISRNPAAGATGEAMAGVGQQIRRFGAILSAEARQAEEQTRELQRDTEASRHVLEVAKAKDTALAEMSQTAEPTAQQEIWNQFQSGVNDLIDHVDDDKTRQYVELQLNNKMPSWNAVAVGSIQQTRLAQADAVDQAMLDDTVRTRTLQPYVEHLDRRLAAGAETQETYTRKKDMAARAVDTGLETDAIRARVKAMPVADAIRELDTMNRPRNLNEEEWGPFRNTLLSELRVEDASAGLEEQKRRAIVQRTEDEFWVKIHSGAATPQGVVEQEKLYVEGKGGIRPETGQQMLQMMANPKPGKDDFDSRAEGWAWVRKVREDATERQKAMDYVRKQRATGKLTDETSELLAKEIQTAGKADDPTNVVGIKVADQLLDDHYKLGTFGEADTIEAQKTYLDAKQALATWGRNHPDAREAEVTQYYQSVIQGLVKPAWWRRVLNGLSRTTMLGVWGIPGAIRQIRGENPEVSVPLAPAATPTYQVRDPDVEPLTMEEWIETYKSLPMGSTERTEYYNKWLHKWQ